MTGAHTHTPSHARSARATLERLRADAASPRAFTAAFVARNRPAVIEGVARDWPCAREWAERDPRGGGARIAWATLVAKFGDARVCAARCWERSYSDQRREEMTLREFVARCEWGGGEGCGQRQLLYLKDWHAAREFPRERFYAVPPQFADDWLNMDAALTGGDDFRFVYAGPRGTWTPCHRDVYASFSWSVNVCGRKRWIFFPPRVADALLDARGECVYDVLARDVDPKRWPRFGEAWAARVECTQEPGDAVFVPSGWYHQVHNLEDALSVNHNWNNVFSVRAMWEALRSELRRVEAALSALSFAPAQREREPASAEWRAQCQHVLRLSAGTDLPGFAAFLRRCAAHFAAALRAASPEALTELRRAQPALIAALRTPRGVADLAALLPDEAASDAAFRLAVAALSVHEAAALLDEVAADPGGCDVDVAGAAQQQQLRAALAPLCGDE